MMDSGYRRSPADHRDWSYRQRVMGATATPSLPRTYRVDARTPLPVYDQGQVPSCVGWGTASMQTALERVDKRRTIRHDGLEFYSRLALPEGGAYPRDALQLWRERGILAADGQPHRISGFSAVDPRDHDAVRHAIHSGRGVCIGFAVTRQWAGAGGQEFTAAEEADVLGGHWSYVSGWKPAGPIVHNSWGEGWGDRGRGLLPWVYWDQHVWECWAVTDLDD